MENLVSEELENILSLLSLEGSFEVDEKEDGVFVSIETPDAGKLIGHGGETLSSLQYLVNIIVARESSGVDKRVVIDVANWRHSKEEELSRKAKDWALKVVESKQELSLPPMPPWQRRVIHMALQEMGNVLTQSEGEGMERHLVIKPK